jgi:hypothetical protein
MGNVKGIIIALACLISGGAFAADEISISVLKIDRHRSATDLLLSVQNSLNQRLERTEWSCVFLEAESPVYEEKVAIYNVPALDTAISQELFGFGGTFDKVKCRLMSVTPTPPAAIYEGLFPATTKR